MAPKVIIVTGASRGIGLAVALYLLNASHKVVLVSRSEEQLKGLKGKFPSQVEYIAADLTNVNVAAEVTKLAIKSFAKIDGVVINHGVLHPMARIEKSSIDEWKELFDANLFSALALAKETIPHLRTSKGRIIFTSSGAAKRAYTSWGAYGASKAALNSLVQHIGVEEPDIVAVALDPGRTDTDMQKDIRETGAPGIAMSEADHANFKEVFEKGGLNKPEWPGHVIAKLSLDAKPEFSGKVILWKAQSSQSTGSSGCLLTSGWLARSEQ